jgi:hypothetical protein
VVVDAILAAQQQNASDFGSTTVGKLIDKLPAEVRDDADKLRQRVETWVDGAMEDMSRNYRSRLRVWTVGIAVVVIAVLGVDSGWLASRYYADATARAAVVAVAESATAGDADSSDQVVTCLSNAGDPDAKTCTNALIDRLDDLNVGRYRLAGDWRFSEGGKPDNACEWIFMILGLAATVGAVAMGAPFWFDVLKRLMGLKKPRAT